MGRETDREGDGRRVNRPAAGLDGELRQEVERALRRHEPALTAAACKWCSSAQEAEDLVSDVYLYAVSHPAKLLEHPNPRAWLFRVMGNRYIDCCRAPKPEAIEQGHLATLGREDQRISRWLAHQALRMALQALPERLATACRLRLEGHKLQAIGTRMGVSTSEAGKLLARAFHQLNDFFTRDAS